MQMVKLPLNFYDKIDRVCNKFIWVDDAERSKVHHVDWKTVCKLKPTGGLRFRKARVMNNLFMMKLLWGLIH